MRDRSNDFGPSFAGFSGFKAAQPVSASYCYTLIVALQPSGASVNAAIGFTIQQNGARLTGIGLQTNLTPTAIRSGASGAIMAIVLQQDLIEKILPTARNAAKRVNFTATTPSK